MPTPYLTEYNQLRNWCAPDGPRPYPQYPHYYADGDDHYDLIEVLEHNRILDNNTTKWDSAIEAAVEHYRDQGVFPEGGRTAGHHAYAPGLALHYLRTGDPKSKEAALLVADNAAGNSDATPAWWAEMPDGSREIAFSIRNKLAAESLGQPHRPTSMRMFITHSITFTGGRALQLSDHMV